MTVGLFVLCIIDLDGSKKGQLNVFASRIEIILKAIKVDNIGSIADMPQGRRYITTQFISLSE